MGTTRANRPSQSIPASRATICPPAECPVKRIGPGTRAAAKRTAAVTCSVTSEIRTSGQRSYDGIATAQPCAKGPAAKCDQLDLSNIRQYPPCTNTTKPLAERFG